MPDFSVIGPVKGGTSDIATTLLLHPCVLAPLSKELPSKEIYRLSAYYPTTRQKDAHRSKYGAALCPFLTPALHSIDFAYKLAHVAPKMKIVVALRNPIKRMYSHWKWEVLIAGKQMLDDIDFMQKFETYVDTCIDLYPCTPMFTVCGALDGLRASIYWQAVKCWQDLFGAANVLVLDSDEYFRGNPDFMSRIHDFVGLPQARLIGLHKRVNENPLKLALPSEDSVNRLNSFFRPHNDRLWDVIGKRFSW